MRKAMSFTQRGPALAVYLGVMAVVSGVTSPALANPPEPTAIDVEVEFERLDAAVIALGPMPGEDYKVIADRLAVFASNDTEKARAIFRWLTENISYDVASFSQFLTGATLQSTVPEDVLFTRTSVCHGYANLFRVMAEHVGLEAKTVAGHGLGWGSKASTDTSQENHAWNAVRIDGKWKLLDATWAAGAVTGNLQYVKRFEPKYFLGSAEVFSIKHTPTNPLWSLQNGDTFDAPVVVSEKNTEFGVQLASPLYEDIRLMAGQATEILVKKDSQLDVGVWISAAGSIDLLAAGTRYIFPTSTDEHVSFTLAPTEPGRYRVWTGARRAGETGPLSIVFEHALIVTEPPLATEGPVTEIERSTGEPQTAAGARETESASRHY